MLFDCFISYLYMRVLKLTLGRKKNLHISLCFSTSSEMRSDRHVLASGRARLCRSLIWKYAVQTSMYHVRTQAFWFLCQTDTHTHTHTTFSCSIILCCVCFLSDWSLDFGILCTYFLIPRYFFDFPYSLKLWLFLEY
jgi:hypothetical protein